MTDTNTNPAEEQPQGTPASEPTTEEQLAEGGFPEDFTAEDLDALSDQEKASILDDQKASQPADPDSEVNDDPAAKPAPDPDPQPSVQPQKPVEFVFDVAAAENQIADLQTQRAALLTEFQDGEISEDDFQAKWEEIDAAWTDAKATVKAAQKVATSTQKQIEDQWYADVDKYHEQFPELMSPDHMKGWDAELRQVNETYPHLDNQTQMQLAHRRYATTAEAIGKPLTQTLDGAPAAKPAEPGKPRMEPRTDERPRTPSLSSVPASDNGGANDGRFAQIDRAIDTDPFIGEEAFARMSPEDQERYLAEG